MKIELKEMGKVRISWGAYFGLGPECWRRLAQLAVKAAQRTVTGFVCEKRVPVSGKGPYPCRSSVQPNFNLVS